MADTRLRWTSLALALACAAALADTYPSKPVRLIVPFTPGSGTDMVARMTGPKLAETFGQQVVVDNRAGAGSVVGTAIVGTATPDGHTLLLTSSGFAGSASVAPKLPYDPIKDFAAVTQIMTTPLVIVVAPSQGVRTLRELVALAKQKPISYASNGAGSGTHYGIELFRRAAKFDATHVPYKGIPEALTDTMAGRIHFTMGPLLAALPLVKDGRVIGLSVTTSQRSPLLPDVPTPAEAGLPEFEYEGWYGLIAPARTPRAVIDRLSAEMKRILDSPDIRDRMTNLGGSAKWTPPEDFARMIRTEIETRAKVLKAPGAR